MIRPLRLKRRNSTFFCIQLVFKSFQVTRI